MKHSPNYQPYDNQCEGWLKLIHHKQGKLPLNHTCVVTDCKEDGNEDVKFICSAVCIRNEPGCSIMQTEDGRGFRVTEHSGAQAYFPYFYNETDSSRAGSKYKNRFFTISGGLEIFLSKGLKAYIIYDIEANEIQKYPTKEERSHIVWSQVAKTLDFNWHHELKF